MDLFPSLYELYSVRSPHAADRTFALCSSSLALLVHAATAVIVAMNCPISIGVGIFIALAMAAYSHGQMLKRIFGTASISVQEQSQSTPMRTFTALGQYLFFMAEIRSCAAAVAIMVGAPRVAMVLAAAAILWHVGHSICRVGASLCRPAKPSDHAVRRVAWATTAMIVPCATLGIALAAALPLHLKIFLLLIPIDGISTVVRALFCLGHTLCCSSLPGPAGRSLSATANSRSDSQ